MEKIPYKKDIGSVVRGLLNGLKHTPETIGPLIGINPDELVAIIEEKEPMTNEVEKALCKVTGINQRDFYPSEYENLFPVIDDTDHGIRLVRSEETTQSGRTLSRGPDNTPYYIYADTAMSNTSTFRPEWIKELYVHDGEFADLPDWAFNKGHFEHQVTYFIGPVNFYWIDQEGKRHVQKMETGDTNYIPPFVPHTFTTREEGDGVILAVTYGGAISNPVFRKQLGDMDISDYLTEMREKLKNVSFFEDPNMKDGVSLLSHHDAESRRGKDSPILTLVNSIYQPDTKIFELTLLKGEKVAYETSSERWIYNVGSQPIFLDAEKSWVVHPGDSVFIKPNIKHTFTMKDDGEGMILVVEIRPGDGDPLAELKVIDHYTGDAGLRRVHTETTRWY